MLAKIFNSVMGRVVMTGGIILVMLIPIGMTRSLIEERSGRSQEVRREIGEQWGNEQDLQGPFLVIPYRLPATRHENSKTGELYLLPETLHVDGELAAEKRHRGIFETVLYGSTLKLSGSFRVPERSLLQSKLPRAGTIFYDQAGVVVSIPHPRGIRNVTPLSWQNREREFVSGEIDGGGGGIHAPVAIARADSIPFSFAMELNGNQYLTLIPAGKKSSVRLRSNWPSPSFFGGYLADHRTITPEGFEASWEISALGRGYDQFLVDPGPELFSDSAFGVRLVDPLDHYQKSERAIKYGVLFLFLTFMAFFLFEIFNRTKIHPIQYFLVGFALVLFYSLLLSLTEHLSFAISYGIASVATIGLISYYTVYILRDRRRAGVIGLFLAGLYGFLYTVLRSEDNAMLMGSLGLFLILGAVMVFTRNVDWYAVRLNER